MPQLTPKEQDEVLKLAAQSKKPPYIQPKIVAARRGRHAEPVDITIRRLMRGKTHRRGAVETPHSSKFSIPQHEAGLKGSSCV